MSSKLLLQEEIDALLGRLNQEQESSKPPQEGQSDKILQISTGLMAQIEKSFAVILNTSISVASPKAEYLMGKELPEGLVFPLVAGKGVFTGELAGQTMFLLKLTDASKLAAALIGNPGASPGNELSEDAMGVVSEIFNQVILIFGDVLKEQMSKETAVDPQTPVILRKADDLLSLLHNEQPGLLVTYEIKVAENLTIQLYQVMSVNLVEALSQDVHLSNSRSQDQPGPPVSPPDAPGAPSSTRVDYQIPLDSSIDKNKLNLILEIPLKVSVVLGKTRVPIKKVLELTTGSLVELSSKVSEPVDVLVNGTLVARGEVIVVNENFGVRINSIISPEERIKYLEG
jgi:flagellar motor switch protein FliN/FliY